MLCVVPRPDLREALVSEGNWFPRGNSIQVESIMPIHRFFTLLVCAALLLAGTGHLVAQEEAADQPTPAGEAAPEETTPDTSASAEEPPAESEASETEATDAAEGRRAKRKLLLNQSMTFSTRAARTLPSGCLCGFMKSRLRPTRAS